MMPETEAIDSNPTAIQLSQPRQSCKISPPYMKSRPPRRILILEARIVATERRLERIFAYVAAQHRREAAKDEWDPVYTADYRWEHTQRVAHYGDLIAREDGFDRELCVAGCLLHDIAYFHSGKVQDWNDHGRIGARISRPVLLDVGFSVKETDIVCHAIAVHVDGKSETPHPHTSVADVVSDADNVDRFSAYRVILRCADALGDFREMTAPLPKRVEQLRGYREKNPLETRTGRKLFADKLDLQITFFEALMQDAAKTQPPLL